MTALPPPATTSAAESRPMPLLPPIATNLWPVKWWDISSVLSARWSLAPSGDEDVIEPGRPVGAPSRTQRRAYHLRWGLVRQVGAHMAVMDSGHRRGCRTGS